MRDIKWIVGLLGFCFLLLIFLSPAVSAYGIIQNETNQSFIPRVEQGSIVYVNETYDISGITGWGKKLAWYGEYATFPDYDITPYTIDLPGKTHTGATSQYRFTITNETFGSRPGRWFQYYDDNNEERGNLLAFNVKLQRPVHFNQTNISGIISYNIENNINTSVAQEPYILEEIKVADYLVARGDDLNIPVNQSTNAWLFGRLDYLYDHHSINNTIDIKKEFLDGLEPGSYTLILQTADLNNNDFTVRFNREKNTIEWFDSKLFMIHSQTLEGYSPYVVLGKIKEIFPKSKDIYSIYKFKLEDPTITITSRDSLYVNGKQVLDIRGYTNVATGTEIKLILDEDKQTSRTIEENTFVGEAKGKIPGNMRYFQIYVPINPNEMSNGIHTITATTYIGGKCFADFPISELPADSFIPNATVKYIGDRNPWVPTPTPEIVIKEVPGPTVTVIVTVTPREEVVRAQQEKVIDDKIGFWIPRIITAVIGLIVLLYLVSVYLRSRKP